MKITEENNNVILVFLQKQQGITTTELEKIGYQAAF